MTFSDIFFTVLHKNVPVSGYSGKCGFLSAEIEGKIEQQSNILSFVSYDQFLSIDLDLVLPFFCLNWFWLWSSNLKSSLFFLGYLLFQFI